MNCAYPQNGTPPDPHAMRINSLILLSTIAIASITSRADAQTKACRPADGYGQGMVAELKKLVTTTDPSEVAARDSFYHVPVVSTTEISLVINQSTCRRAAKALTAWEDSNPPVITSAAKVSPSAAPARTPSRQVVVAKHGTYWAVEDPDRRPDGRYLTVVIFDSQWKQVGGFTGP